MMDRRTFIGGLAVAALETRFTSAAAEHQIPSIGVQLYTVRDALQRDFEGTLARVAQIGYKEVEFAGYFAEPTKLKPVPPRTRQILDSDGLSAPSTHVPYSALSPDKWPRVIEASQILGHKYVVNPSIDEQLTKTADGWKQAAETFNRAGSESLRSGIQFGYHNHTGEFKAVDGKLPYDILLSECDPHLVKMEMDLGWAHVAGVDPLKYFSQYPGRFPLVHVKDFDRNGQMTEVGHGIIDWKRIFAQSNVAGIKHYFVEHDHPKSPFASIQTSYEYLKNLEF
jgi:sugar phosphate isomerase/epimerase